MEEKLEKKYWETKTNIGEVKRSSSHPVVEFFSDQRIQYVRKHIDLDLIESALDVGTGTGYSSKKNSNYLKVTGVDFSFRNLKINLLDQKIQSSAYELPFLSDSFDLVYGWDFLHHLENPEKAILEMARVTKKYLVLFEPNRNNPVQFIYALLNKNERGTLQFTKRKLIELINQINFELIVCETVGWIFAGASPTFSLPFCKHLPFSHKIGISVALISKKY